MKDVLEKSRIGSHEHVGQDREGLWLGYCVWLHQNIVASKNYKEANNTPIRSTVLECLQRKRNRTNELDITETWDLVQVAYVFVLSRWK